MQFKAKYLMQAAENATVVLQIQKCNSLHRRCLGSRVCEGFSAMRLAVASAHQCWIRKNGFFYSVLFSTKARLHVCPNILPLTKILPLSIAFSLPQGTQRARGTHSWQLHHCQAQILHLCPTSLPCSESQFWSLIETTSQLQWQNELVQATANCTCTNVLRGRFLAHKLGQAIWSSQFEQENYNGWQQLWCARE